MISVQAINHQPTETDELWSYPISELDYVLETAQEGAIFFYYDGRLYETEKEI